VLDPPWYPVVAGLCAFAGALVALALYHRMSILPHRRRLQELLATHDELLGGGTGERASQRIAAVEQTLAEALGRLGRVEELVAELRGCAQTDLSRIGLVRYDAFDDAGSKLSYALALLNREGDGVVLSSIYSRSDCRTYAKAVERFMPVVAASEEELQAIRQARDASTTRAC
jgi:hypothetical protein